MDLTFSIDFDAAEIHGVVDGATTFTVIKDDDRYIYKNFDRIDDDVLKDKLKGICRELLQIEES